MKRPKDPYEKVFFNGEGCRGIPRKYTTREYNLWYSMMNRCYNEKCKDYVRYGAKGVHVCDRWHCFEYFLEDIVHLRNYKRFMNTNDYSFDKDKNQISKLSCDVVYSPKTCQFIPKEENCKYTAMHREDAANKTSPYYGVSKTRTGNFQSAFHKNKTRYFLGTYDNEIAAATVYNYVEKQCSYFPKLNIGIPYMNINEALSHMVGTKAPTFPPNFDNTGLEIHVNNSHPYFGVGQIGENRYRATYSCNNTPYNIGVYDDPIAAANAHNYYSKRDKTFCLINDVPYMSPSEWLSHKTTSKKNVTMCHIIN